MRQLQRLRLLFWTLRYLTPTQMWYRGRRLIRRRLPKIIRPRPVLTPTINSGAPALYAGLADVSQAGPWADEMSAAVERACAVNRRHFEFLEQEVTFPDEIGWHDAKLSQLWRYHLHYFGYVQDLLVWASSGQTAEAYQTFRALAQSWINQNPPPKGDGWHPYTLSLRLVNWMHAATAFAPQIEADQEFSHCFFDSLYSQARALANDLELDVRGNHLMENLRALLWAGFFFEGSEARRWHEQALSLLEAEIAEQILADGGHFERTSGYHLVMLRDCLEIALWLRRNQGQAPAWLDAALRRMLEYLLTILPPNQRVPLLKDTAWDAAPAPADLMAAGALYFDEPTFKRSEGYGLYPLLLFGLSGYQQFTRWPLHEVPLASRALEASGHYVLRDDNRGDHLIFDAGKPCPDYLPAHAHADIFTYELTVSGLPIVVDSGVYQYAAGNWRNFFRSTRAHNTVEIAGANQSEVWSSFRVARRARVQNVRWQENDDLIIVQGEHDGYRRLPIPITHRRTLLWRKGYFWLIADELFGTGETAASSYVHLHPDLHFEPLENKENTAWQITGSTESLWLTAFGHKTHNIVSGQPEPSCQGWYSERFGHKQPNTVLALNANAQAPFCFGYLIAERAPGVVNVEVASNAYRITIEHENRVHELNLGRATAPVFQ